MTYCNTALSIRAVPVAGRNPVGVAEFFCRAFPRVAADGNPGLEDATALRLQVTFAPFSQGSRGRQLWAGGRNRVARTTNCIGGMSEAEPRI
jgi:hypothetical protein